MYEIFRMNSSETLLQQLGLTTINEYRFIKYLGGGSALSALYESDNKKIVFKFLIAPRNIVELERFKLECSVLEKNRANWRNGAETLTEEQRKTFFIGPYESYPLPKVLVPLVESDSGEIIYFGYEYEEGELLSALDTSTFSIEEKLLLLYRIASGLNYFNQTGYSHRDLHPSNILLLSNPTMPKYDRDRADVNSKVKFLDLGNCQWNETETDYIYKIGRELDEDLVFQDNNKRLLASFVSMPPDFLLHGKNTKNYDSWSFGIYAYKLLFGTLPFEANEIADITLLRDFNNFNSDFRSKLQSVGVGFEQIMLRLLSPDGERRPEIHSIVRLFSWLVHRIEDFQDVQFINTVIDSSGFDPYYDPIDDIY
ncbi:protein kinase [Pseudoalteromonas sp. bablab_jr004]|uniref:protein kinase domain-containing protein n=1 Tax=Pseudoalteromonas sp. bablab_jr004 TaxID=2755065 RepID=UPI0018F6524F|nr:protein kinase [Pseudoalteromonas sp. bablab_jr004]